MERLDYIIAAFLRKQKRTLEEDLTDFFKDLLADLKNLAQYKIIKLSSNKLYIKDKVIANSIENTEGFLNDFNEYMQHHASVWEEILKKHKAPKSLENEQAWVLSISTFKNDLRDHLVGLKNRANGLHGNLQFLENNYEINSKTDTKIKHLKIRLKTLIKINYSKFINTLFKGKLIQV